MNHPLLFAAIVNGVVFVMTGDGWMLAVALGLPWAAHAARSSA
jgi:hypothetical protein